MRKLRLREIKNFLKLIHGHTRWEPVKDCDSEAPALCHERRGSGHTDDIKALTAHARLPRPVSRGEPFSFRHRFSGFPLPVGEKSRPGPGSERWGLACGYLSRLPSTASPSGLTCPWLASHAAGPHQASPRCAPEPATSAIFLLPAGATSGLRNTLQGLPYRHAFCEAALTSPAPRLSSLEEMLRRLACTPHWTRARCNLGFPTRAPLNMSNVSRGHR